MLGLLGLVCDFQAVEQHFAHLLGRGDVELHTCQAVHFFFYLVHAGGEVARGFLQGFGIDAHTVAFHIGKYGHERHFDVAEEGFGIVLLQFFLQYVFQLQGDIGILARVPIYIDRVKVAHILLVLSFRADEFFYFDGFVVQVDFGKVVHSVMQFGLEHIVGYHRVEHFALQFYSVVRQDQHIVFDVLSHF